MITKAVATDDDGGQQVVAIKAGKAKKKLVLEPHDISKELRLLSSLSHPAVRLHISPLCVACMFTRVQIISVLGHDYNAPQSLQRFWMPFMPFTLADLLSVPTFSPMLDSDVPHDAQSVLGFTIVTKSIFHQVLSGVAYLHSSERRIAHRDIKPRNILLDTLGVAVLIDFGVAYSPTADERDVWHEPEGKMYFEVGSGYVRCFPTWNMRRRGSVVVLFRPYRAPELLFGARKYDATACDLWALGATFTEFFTTLHRRPLSSEFDDDSDTEERGDPTKAYLFDELPDPWSRFEWERYSLFDGSRGDIGLAWSIFRTRGSPTQETWPVRFLSSIHSWIFSHAWLDICGSTRCKQDQFH